MVVKQQSWQTEKELCPVIHMVDEFNLLMMGWTDFSQAPPNSGRKGERKLPFWLIYITNETGFYRNINTARSTGNETIP